MTSLTDELIERHTRYALDRLTAEGPENLVQHETQTALVWLDEVSLESLVASDEATQRLTELLRKAKMTRQLEALLRDLVGTLVASRHLEAVKVRHVAPRTTIEALGDKLDAFVGLRDALIDQALSSAIFAEFLSNILYHGIKDYLLTENFLAKRMPGASSLMRLGKGVMNKTAPGIETAVEKTIKEYIAANLARPIALTKRFIERELTAERTREIALAAWDEHRDEPVGSLTAGAGGKDLADVAVVLAKTIARWNKIPRLPKLANEMVDCFYTRYGSRPVTDLLALMGIDRSSLAAQVSHLLRPVITHAVESGHMEARIRAHMEEFYRSKEAVELLQAKR